jgi:hypothetical protein
MLAFAGGALGVRHLIQARSGTAREAVEDLRAIDDLKGTNLQRITETGGYDAELAAAVNAPLRLRSIRASWAARH